MVAAQLTKNGETLFRETQYNTFFRSSVLAVQRAEYEFNRMYALGEGDASLALFFKLLEIKPPNDALTIGWDPDYMMDEWECWWIDFMHRPQFTDNGTPYIEISYPIPPVSLFYERSY